MNTHLSVPATMPTSTVMARINAFLDQHVLPYPVKYLTNRITILATLCLLVPLIVLANVTVFVLAANSYLNVMSVVVSSTVLLYSTLAEARDRAPSRPAPVTALASSAALPLAPGTRGDACEGPADPACTPSGGTGVPGGRAS